MNDKPTVASVRSVTLRLEPGEHPFHTANRENARANWACEIIRQPALFDGTVSLASAVTLDDGRLDAACHLVPYSTFIHWRGLSQPPGACHVFAMAFVASSDDAMIVARMADATANPGRVYCPSGSFDEDDLRDGAFDPAVNVTREVREETGLDLDSATIGSTWQVFRVGRSVILFRLYRIDETAAALVRGIRAHIASDPDSEIADAIALRSPHAVTDAFSPHMPTVVDWFFNMGIRSEPPGDV